MAMHDIKVDRYAPGDEKDIMALIVPIQREEFGIEISAEDQPDLMQIQSFYQTGTGDFWLARRQGEVIGTIGLKDIGNGEVALRKMFVAAPWRGRDFGVAKQMLELLIEASKARGVKRIYLGTTERFLAAHRFYEKHGFELIKQQDLPASFPLMVVDTRFYALAL
ncbi:GNAT family N-acetyltransferase [Pseudomonas sp. DSP3-2-2]|uniref:GNAT family N-acetyltransferase n=1 Tax=unclassified Pseudomonas TaxID=196821 RepID=UPI003CF58328